MDSNKIKKHFQKVDPILYKLIQKIGSIEPIKPRAPNAYFQSICREIIGQQLNGKVARIIFDRFTKLFPNKKVTLNYVLKIPDAKIRKIGPSWSKVSFVKDLAKNVVGGTLNLKKLKGLSDEQIMAELTKVKGIGPWTAQMFLIFTLGREDVFSKGDLGLRKAITTLYGQKEIESITQKWSPYKTYACRVLWKSLEP
ncbi:MAG: DNA-3-methyladenine glycosylase 2 family protein [DPANN group archaeon]|nr:DNA-3-methyladenine glycosylase 2 family protein [DPANN group archaeon]